MAAKKGTTDRRPQVVRVYGAERRRRGDGYRVLVDRLWPRGIRKDDLEIDEWAKVVAPSSELRKWYGHDVERFEEFDARYRSELADGEAAKAVGRLAGTLPAKPLTLLTATKDVEHSGALVLERVIEEGSG